MTQRSVNVHALRRVLTVATIAYLALPIVIFLLGWLRPGYGITLGLLVTVAVAHYAAGAWRGRTPVAAAPEMLETPGRALTAVGLVAAVLPIVVLVLISGAGGWGPQDTDWVKHNAILKDLVERPWPVVYQTPHDPVMMVYYTAYYLPAALAGKVGGWILANDVLFATTLVGAILAGLWLLVITRARPAVAGLVFALASGTDIVGWMLRNGPASLARIGQLSGDHIERWAGLWEYSANTTLLFWVPQHAIVGWLATALLVDAVQRDDPRIPWLLLVALATLWSPFAALGLAPVILCLLVAEPRHVAARVRAAISPENLVGVIVLLVMGLYFAARAVPFTIGGGADTAPSVANGFLPWIGADLSLGSFIRRYVVFCGVEFLLLGFVAWRCLRGSSDPRVKRLLFLLSVCCATLLLLPLFRYGYFNDLVMRAGIPSLFVLWVAVLDASWQRRSWVAALAVLLVIGLPTPGLEIHRHLEGIRAAGRLVAIPAEPSVQDIFQLQSARENIGFQFTRQYLGSDRSFFATHLASEQQRPASVISPALPAAR